MSHAREVGLMLHRCSDGTSPPIAADVPDSKQDGSFPLDYAAYVSGPNSLHIVYGGVRGTAKPERALWHVVLDAKGAVVSERALGAAVDLPAMTRIFVGPDSHLHVLEVYQKQDALGSDDWRFGHRVLELGAAAVEPGPAARFFLDDWLQVHVVWFEGGEARYHGPSKGL